MKCLVKTFAFQTPIIEALNDIYKPCNQLCHLNGFCTKPISGNSILDLRKKYFRDAPKDKERSQLIMGICRHRRSISLGRKYSKTEQGLANKT